MEKVKCPKLLVLSRKQEGSFRDSVRSFLVCILAKW